MIMMMFEVENGSTWPAALSLLRICTGMHPKRSDLHNLGMATWTPGSGVDGWGLIPR